MSRPRSARRGRRRPPCARRGGCSTRSGRNWPRPRAVVPRRTSPARSRRSLAEPACDGDAEAGLAAVEDLRRQVGGERAAERDLPVEPSSRRWSGRPSASSASWWSRSGARSSSEFAIEAMSALKSRSSGKVRLDVDQLQARDARCPRRAEQRAGRRELPDPASASSVQRLRRELEREHLHQPAVALRRVEARPCRGSGPPGTAPSAARCAPTAAAGGPSPRRWRRRAGTRSSRSASAWAR